MAFTMSGIAWDLCLFFSSEPGDIGSAPGCMMMDHPIDESDVKSNVPTCFFALDPFVTEYFRFLGAKCLVKPRFHEAFRHTLGNKRTPGRVGGAHGRGDFSASPARSACGFSVFIMRISFCCLRYGFYQPTQSDVNIL